MDRENSERKHWTWIEKTAERKNWTWIEKTVKGNIGHG